MVKETTYVFHLPDLSQLSDDLSNLSVNVFGFKQGAMEFIDNSSIDSSYTKFRTSARELTKLNEEPSGDAPNSFYHLGDDFETKLAYAVTSGTFNASTKDLTFEFKCVQDVKLDICILKQ